MDDWLNMTNHFNLVCAVHSFIWVRYWSTTLICWNYWLLILIIYYWSIALITWKFLVIDWYWLLVSMTSPLFIQIVLIIYFLLYLSIIEDGWLVKKKKHRVNTLYIKKRIYSGLWWYIYRYIVVSNL